MQFALYNAGEGGYNDRGQSQNTFMSQRVNHSYGFMDMSIIFATRIFFFEMTPASHDVSDQGVRFILGYNPDESNA